MAEVALTSIAKTALKLFSSLAKDEALLLWNSPKELQRLHDTIETIGCLLQDADKMQSEREAVLSCLSRLRNVMYEADDLFDSLAWELLQKKTMPGDPFTKEVRLFFSNSNQVGTFFKVAHQVKSLRGSLDQIKSDMVAFGFTTQQPLVVQQVLRFDRVKTHSFVQQEDVIGRDQDKDRIVNMLLDSPSRDKALSVIAVIGFGGLGKTTLAQLIYNDERVKKEFDVCLWACINYLSDLEQVLIEIIASKGVKHHDMGLEQLQEKLRAIIGGKKFLLVIDDLWDENYEKWSRLETLLRCGSSGKVLVTTRSVKVAECLDAPKCSRLDLELLSEESAWCLFVKRAFCEEEASQYPELEALGRKIMSKCGNVPLSIIVVGSLLRHRKREVRTWSDFLENELGKALSNGGSVRDVLLVSYRDLHPNLKLCFAYCSLFPKDHVFKMELLVRLWISQGFVETDEGNTQKLEEQGEAYFFYLVDRCFFQQYGEYHFGYMNAYGAKMHDLIHDVAIDVAKTEILLFDRDHISSGKSDSLRHISINTAEIDASYDFDKLVSDTSTVRTILATTEFYQITNISSSSLDVILTSFRMLRTLSCSGSKIESISDSIGELIHLRYLNLSNSWNLRQLPNSICKIHHLITLDLRKCGRLEKLPPKIGQLISLRHLCIERCYALKSFPHGFAALTSLVSLDRILVHRERGGLGYLKNLNHLRGFMQVDLPLYGWFNAIEDAKRSNMSEKHKLRRLLIRWTEKGVKGNNSTQEMTSSEAKAVMDALEPSQNLEQLEIENYGGVKLPSWLFMIKNVKELSLEECEYVECLEDGMKDSLCFSSIEIIRISKMKNLKGWWRQEIVQESQRPCLDKLTFLSISDCPELKGKLPLLEGVENLRLQRVDVQLVHELIMVMNLNKLKYVDLSEIKGLVCLPEEWIGHLTCLETLVVNNCGDLKWVSCRGLAKLTSLNSLKITNCECEIRDEDEEDNTEGMPWKALQGLLVLEIPVSDMQLVEELESLTSLKNLIIGKWVNREDFVLPSKGTWQNLGILNIGFKKFNDRKCDLRQTGIHNLPSLRSLSVRGCKELYLCWETLLFGMDLTYLTFTNVGSVIGVEPVQQTQRRAPTIQLLQVEGTIKWVNGGVEEEQLLPDQIQHLSSLQSLYISEIYGKVRSIPKWFPRLKSLRSLRIQYCSRELKRRCEKEKGEDWPLISHITHIYIDPMNPDISNWP